MELPGELVLPAPFPAHLAPAVRELAGRRQHLKESPALWAAAVRVEAADGSTAPHSQDQELDAGPHNRAAGSASSLVDCADSLLNKMKMVQALYEEMEGGRVKFSNKSDYKRDPNFHPPAAMGGDVEETERRMLEPSAEAACRRPSPPLDLALLRDQQPADAIVQVHVARPAAGAAAGEATPRTAAAGAAAGAGPPHVPASGKRPPPPSLSDGKRQKLAGVGELGHDDDASTQFRGVRFQGDNWQARTKRNGKELSLGLYNTAEEAGMAYDLDRLNQQGAKAQRLNFPLLRQHYKQILADLADLLTPDGLLDFLAVAVQAAVKAARSVPGATAPENTGPAAAALLNPRRPAVPLSLAALPVAATATLPAQPTMQRKGLQEGGRVVLAAAPAQTESDSDFDEPELTLLEQAVAARAHAGQLAATRSLAAGLALCSTAFVQLEAGSGLAWRMTCLACPVDATVGMLALAVGAGLEQQYGLPTGTAVPGFCVASDLDATADFDALSYEDAESGMLLLRSHVDVRSLLSMLRDRQVDLCLEYHVTTSGAASQVALEAARL